MRTLTSEQLESFRRNLTKRRDGIFERHRQAEDDRRTLAEPEIEFEEAAEKESIADVLAVVDEREEKEVGAIDRALEKIRLGTYGYCEVCGRAVALKRLEAIPWTSVCTRHGSTGGERAAAGGTGRERTAAFPPGYEGLSGRELGEVIADEVREDGGVDMEELRIAVRRRRVYLEGCLPDTGQHERLLEILRGHLEIPTITDKIVISRMPWDREDRAPGGSGLGDFPEGLDTEEADTLVPEE